MLRQAVLNGYVHVSPIAMEINEAFSLLSNASSALLERLFKLPKMDQNHPYTDARTDRLGNLKLCHKAVTL
jgi:hypothetical protein